MSEYISCTWSVWTDNYRMAMRYPIQLFFDGCVGHGDIFGLPADIQASSSGLFWANQLFRDTRKLSAASIQASTEFSSTSSPV